jgi:glucose repression regulatory protein TUP1
LREQRAAAGLAPPSPLREFPKAPPLSASTSSQSVIQTPEDRGRVLSYDRKMKGRARDYSEFESEDYREPKRMRSNRGW